MSSPDENFTLNTRGKRPSFFQTAETDALMTALLETMSQLWATRSQVRVLQQLLLEKGVLTQKDLDQFEFGDAERMKDHQSMQEFFSDAFRAMSASTQSIDSRQKEIDQYEGYNTDKSDP